MMFVLRLTSVSVAFPSLTNLRCMRTPPATANSRCDFSSLPTRSTWRSCSFRQNDIHVREEVCELRTRPVRGQSCAMASFPTSNRIPFGARARGSFAFEYPPTLPTEKKCTAAMRDHVFQNMAVSLRIACACKRREGVHSTFRAPFGAWRSAHTHRRGRTRAVHRLRGPERCQIYGRT